MNRVSAALQYLITGTKLAVRLIMKTTPTRIFSFSILANMLSGCYTQLEVVERPAPYSQPYERPEPNRAYNPQDEVRLDERAYELDEFSEDSYYAGYDDGFSDLEIYYRDYDRYQPVSSRNEYSLGYSDGYHDASWSYYRNRFHTRFYGGYWDPFWYDSYWAFHVSWGWNRPHHFWHYSPYYYSSYYGYAHPVFFYGYHRPYHGWGGYGNTWIVYNHNTVNNNVYRGPRNSGVSRDGRNVGRGVASTNVRGDNRTTVSSGSRNSGVSRDNTTVRRSPATEGRSRGTVGRSTSQTGRSSGRTVRTGTSRPGSSGTVQRGNTGRSSGTVRSGRSRSRSSSTEGRTRRPRGNDLQSSNDLPVVLPGDTRSRERLVNTRDQLPQPPRTTSRTGINRSSADQGVYNTRTNGRSGSAGYREESTRPSGMYRNASTGVSRNMNRPQTSSATRQPSARPAPTPRSVQPSARPAPAPRPAPAARPAPAQRSQSAATPQRSRTTERSTSRSRNRD